MSTISPAAAGSIDRRARVYARYGTTAGVFAEAATRAPLRQTPRTGVGYPGAPGE